MPVKPQLRQYGSSYGRYGGNLLTDYTVSGNVDSSLLNRNTGHVNTEFSEFEEQIKDYVLASLGHPVIRVELTPFQLKVAIDEAISQLSHHAPLWSRQFAVFKATVGENVYELPRWMIHNLSYVVYKKTLLSITSQAGTLEFDFFLKYFQDNHLFGDLSIGEFFLLQQNLEQLRKILSQEGSWEVIDNNHIQIHPVPVTDDMDVILEYRAINADSIHPAYLNWIQRYALAKSKETLGQIRGKYKTLPGPGGGAQMNGMELIEQAQRDKELLKEELIGEIEEPVPPTAF